MRTVNQSAGTTREAEQAAAAAEARFTTEVIPIRADLLHAAYRYTRNKHDAEDLIQETYARAWKKFGTFEQGTNVRAWMSRIMVNIWIDTHRRTTRRVQETLAGSFWEEEHAGEALTATPSAEDVALQDHTDDVLKQCVGTLPMGFQSVIFYADVCQYSMRDVAAIERIPLGTAMSRRHRAHHRLRAQLISSGHEGRGESGGPTGDGRVVPQTH